MLLSVCVKTGVVLKHNYDTANTWPYALDYIAVPIPAEDWNIGEEAAWLLLQCICNLLANVSLRPSAGCVVLLFLAAVRD